MSARAGRVVSLGAALGLGAGLLAAHVAAAPPGRPPPPPREVGPLPFLPSVARVRVGLTRDRVVVTHAVTLPRGEWKSGDLDLYFAYGGPGAPIALDAHLLHVADGDLEARDSALSAAGDVVPYDRAPSRPPSAHPLIGRPKMAGVVLHVREAAFRAAAADGMAELRVRALYPLPALEPDAAREVRVRLGSSVGAPLTLARVQLLALDREVPLLRGEAHLCGPDAETRPLALSLTPKPPPEPTAPIAPAAPIAPVLSVRHASDDLCVRMWTGPAPGAPAALPPAASADAGAPVKAPSSTPPGPPGS